MVKGPASIASLPGFKSQLGHLLATRSWAIGGAPLKR